MTDIVERLRSHIVGFRPDDRVDATLKDGADEIERLRDLLRAWSIYDCSRELKADTRAALDTNSAANRVAGVTDRRQGE